MAMESGRCAERGDWDHDGHLVVVMSGAIMGIPAWNAFGHKTNNQALNQALYFCWKPDQLSRPARDRAKLCHLTC